MAFEPKNEYALPGALAGKTSVSDEAANTVILLAAVPPEAPPEPIEAPRRRAAMRARRRLLMSTSFGSGGVDVQRVRHLLDRHRVREGLEGGQAFDRGQVRDVLRFGGGDSGDDRFQRRGLDALDGPQIGPEHDRLE